MQIRSGTDKVKITLPRRARLYATRKLPSEIYKGISIHLNTIYKLENVKGLLLNDFQTFKAFEALFDF